MSDGATVYECTSPDEVVDLLQGGQGVFGIAVAWSGGTWRAPCPSCTVSAWTPARRWSATTRPTSWPGGAIAPSERLSARARRAVPDRRCDGRLSVAYGSIGGVRGAPTILHLDMDAFFAAAEQASKPSLRGKPVVVGGLGPRGVVVHRVVRGAGVRGALGDAHGPGPAALRRTRRIWCRASSSTGTISEQVMELLRRLSPLVEPLSLDEAFVDLEAGGAADDAARRARGR